MDKFEIAMSFDRETRNTIRYVEDPVNGPPVISTLYVQKWALGSDPPVMLRVTLEEDVEA